MCSGGGLPKSAVRAAFLISTVHKGWENTVRWGHANVLIGATGTLHLKKVLVVGPLFDVGVVDGDAEPHIGGAVGRSEGDGGGGEVEAFWGDDTTLSGGEIAGPAARVVGVHAGNIPSYALLSGATIFNINCRPLSRHTEEYQADYGHCYGYLY